MKQLRYIILLFIITTFCQKPAKKHKIVREIKKNQKKSTQLTQNKDSDWVEIHSLDSTFVYDIRYATTNNFVHKKMYPCAKCYVRRVVARALLKVQKELKDKGLRLKLFDCYRPGTVQQALWKIRPDPHYVANPKNGSMHNRGQAVDVTIVDKNGKELDMGTPYDYFGKKAYHAYQNLPDSILKNRLFLKKLMKKYDLEPITSEWWHYSYRKKVFPIADWVWKCP